MANSIKENQYWLRLVVCASEHVNPGLLCVLPLISVFSEIQNYFIHFYQHHKHLPLSTDLKTLVYLGSIGIAVTTRM